MRKLCGKLYAEELEAACKKLPDNENYLFLIVDDKKNRNLPYTTYLFSVVLPFISQALPDHPAPMALYKFFEDEFAPLHTCTINGEQFAYCDLKTEKTVDIGKTIEKIAKYALDEWGIEIPEPDELSKPQNREFQSQAYLNQEVAWNSFLSSRNNLTKDERRSKEIKRV